MPLSPHEAKVLKIIEEDLRVEEPALAAALSAPQSPLSTEASSPLSVCHILHLLALLIGLVAVSSLFGEQLGVLGMGILTCTALVPWLVGTTRSAQNRHRGMSAADRGTTRGEQDKRGSSTRAAPLLAKRGALHLAVALVLVVLGLIPPALFAIVPLVLTLAVLSWLPWLVLRVMEWAERRGTST